jgi:hypothetical protein
MSGRGLDVSQINASADSHRVVVPLLEFHFDSGTLYLACLCWDLPVGATTYTRAPLQFAPVRESASSTEGMQFTMNGLDPAILAIAVNEPWQGRTVRVLKAYLQKDSNQLIGTPKTFFLGRLRNFAGTEDNGSANMAAFAEHYDAELQHANPVRFTDADQQRLFPGDRGCEFAALNSDKQIVWPSKEAQKYGKNITRDLARRIVNPG